jgi:hypothetical protein
VNLHRLVLEPVLALRSPYIITKVIYYFRTYLELNNDYYFEEKDLIFRCSGEKVCFFAVGPEISCNISRNFILNSCTDFSKKIPF